MPIDTVTEDITHFIGLFELTVDEARLRETYAEFSAARMAEPQTREITFIPPQAPPEFELGDFDPLLNYRPQPFSVIPWPVETGVGFTVSGVRPDHDLPGVEDGDFSMSVLERITLSARVATKPNPVMEELEAEITLQPPPPEIAVVLVQKTALSDNDFINVGGSDIVFTGLETDPLAAAAVAREAAELTIVDELDMPGTHAAMGALVEDFPAQLAAAMADGSGDEPVVWQETIDGEYANGQSVSELPDLADHRRDPDTDDIAEDDAPVVSADGQGMANNEGGGATAGSAEGDGAVVVDPFVNVVAGSNTLVNQVSLSNFMLGSPVFAVMGDSHEVNAISQINAYSSNFAASPALRSYVDHAPTDAFNVAQFVRSDPIGGASDGSAPGSQVFTPTFTRIDGDVIFMNWIDQYNFMLDNDVVSLTSSGVRTTVIAGDNGAYNAASLFEFGKSYDLVIVEENIYDANFIHQMNVILDNDIFAAIGGFSTNGKLAIEAGDNLLWNQATIQNIGSADRFSAMTDGLIAAANAMSEGVAAAMNGRAISDPAVAGLQGLKILYIAGSIYDIQYLSQTNVLQDNDQIAFAPGSASKDAAYSVKSGANELINVATIIDYDAMPGVGSYLNGTRYSDEILIQADLIDTSAPIIGGNIDQLVNEAVAFLTDDDLAEPGEGFGGLDHLINGAGFGQFDGLTSMVA